MITHEILLTICWWRVAPKRAGSNILSCRSHFNTSCLLSLCLPLVSSPPPSFTPSLWIKKKGIYKFSLSYIYRQSFHLTVHTQQTQMVFYTPTLEQVVGWGESAHCLYHCHGTNLWSSYSGWGHHSLCCVDQEYSDLHNIHMHCINFCISKTEYFQLLIELL